MLFCLHCGAQRRTFRFQVTPFNIIDAKRVWGPESAIPHRASGLLTFRSCSMGPENVQVAFKSGMFYKSWWAWKFSGPIESLCESKHGVSMLCKSGVYYKRQWPASFHGRVRSFVRMHRANASGFAVCCVLQHFVAQRVIKIHSAAAHTQKRTKL